MKKRFLCFVLVFALCLAMCPVGAWAAEDIEEWPADSTPKIIGVEFKEDYKKELNNKKYDGEAVPDLEAKDLILVAEGHKYHVPTGDDFDCQLTKTWNGAATLPIDAGSYTLNLHVALSKKGGTTTDSEGNTSSNATAVIVNKDVTISFHITPIEITPVLRDNITKSYDGSTSYTFSTRELSPIDYVKTGILARDYDTVAFRGQFYYEYTTVGEHNFFGREISVTGSPNYCLADELTSFNIKDPVKAAITRAAPPSNSKSDTLLVRNRQKRTYVYNLSGLLPNKSLSYGDITYSLHSLELFMPSFFAQQDESKILGDPNDGADIYLNPDNEGQLIVNIKDAPQSGSHAVATIHVDIRTAHYTDISATLYIHSDDRTPVEILNLEAANRPGYTGNGVLGYSGWPEFKVKLSDGELQDLELAMDDPNDPYKTPLVKTYEATSRSQSGTYGPTSTPPTEPGEYNVTVSIPDSNKDYAGSWTGTFTIVRAKVTVRALNRKIQVDDPVPNLKNPELGVDYEVTGLASGDTLKTPPSMKYATVADAIMPGEFEILIDGAMVPSTTRYDPAIEYKTGKLTVKSHLDKEDDVNPFSDVSEYAWYVTAVKYVYNKGLMNGVTDTLFGPTRNLTRGMLVTILYRMEDEPAVWNTMPFTDLDRNAYYLNAVRWASSSRIVNGYGDGRFGPNDALTREQLAIILYNYTQLNGVSVNKFASLDAFTDAYKTTPAGYRALQWARAEGLIEGTGSTTISPKERAIRAQVAVILMRYCINVLHEFE